jgi:hypothetical protein
MWLVCQLGSRLIYVGDIQTIGVDQIDVVPRHLPTSRANLQEMVSQLFRELRARW